MTLILDTSAIVALTNMRDPGHRGVRAALREERGKRVVPAPITAEADYMVNSRVGPAAARRFLRDLALGAFDVVCLEPQEYTTVVELDQRYADLNLGLADLSIVVLARRFDTRRILTFDSRHFGAIEPLQGGRFELLPA